MVVNALTVPVWFATEISNGQLQLRLYAKKQTSKTWEIKPGGGYRLSVKLEKPMAVDKEITNLFSVIPVDLSRPVFVSYMTNSARDTVIIDLKFDNSSLN